MEKERMKEVGEQGKNTETKIEERIEIEGAEEETQKGKNMKTKERRKKWKKELMESGTKQGKNMERQRIERRRRMQ